MAKLKIIKFCRITTCYATGNENVTLNDRCFPGRIRVIRPCEGFMDLYLVRPTFSSHIFFVFALLILQVQLLGKKHKGRILHIKKRNKKWGEKEYLGLISGVKVGLNIVGRTRHESSSVYRKHQGLNR